MLDHESLLCSRCNAIFVTLTETELFSAYSMCIVQRSEYHRLYPFSEFVDRVNCSSFVWHRDKLGKFIISAVGQYTSGLLTWLLKSVGVRDDSNQSPIKFA